MTPAVVPAVITIFTGGVALVAVAWGVGLVGLGVTVAGGMGVAAGVAVNAAATGLGGFCSRPIWNVPRQAVMARKKTIAAIKMRVFI
jgi:hypothetical protein